MMNLKLFVFNDEGVLIREKILDNSLNVEDLRNFYDGKNGNIFMSEFFPPEKATWNNSEKQWKNEKNENLKVFSYDQKGNLINEELYSDFLNNLIIDNFSNFFNFSLDPNIKILLDFNFPPEDYYFNDIESIWKKNENSNNILELQQNESKKTEEIEIEEIEEIIDNNETLKVFVYNKNGEKIKESPYSSFIETYDYVIDYNSKNTEDFYNIYPGTEFPPKGYKWNSELFEWVELTKYEKFKLNHLDIPNDCFVVNDLIVRKSLSQLHKEGLFKILPTQKIDEEYNIVIDKSTQELLDENLISWEEIFDNYYKIFKKKLDDYLDIIYFKYPKSIIFQFEYKAKIAEEWKNLDEEKREISKASNFEQFILLISEFKNLEKDYTKDEICIELDNISNKILQKKSEIDADFGYINNFFNILNAEIMLIKEEKDFLKLFNFISNVENKINEHVKKNIK